MANWLWVGLVGLCVMAAGPALGQDAKDTTKDGDAKDTTQVVVQGRKSDVSDRIDRRVYDIKNDPDSQTGTAGEVLNKLPSVSVTPANQVTLRGDSGVTVLIDGKYPISSNFLQTLAASDIDRIEVMTNPSAQYEADGTGGIINIITKKRHPFGLSGTLVGRASTQGQVSGNTSISLTQGPWSVTGRLSAGTFPGLYRSASTETSPDVVHSHQRTDYGSRFSNGELEVARKIGDHQTVTLNAAYYPNWSRLEETDDYASSSRVYTTRQTTIAKSDWGQTEFIYDDNNDKTGRHFTFDASLGEALSTDRVLTTDTYTYPAAGQAIYGTYDRSSRPVDDIKADFESHPASGHILTAGVEWKRDGEDEQDLYSDSGTIAGPHPDGTTRAFFGQRDLAAVYVTYQHPLFAGWTMLPGLRAEYEALDIRSLGQEARPHDLNLYPTLHLSHDWGKGKIKLSYSRRVDRPWFEQYDPARVYQSAVFASEGNPDLKASTTDAYELGYEYSQGKVSTDMTAYYRVMGNAVSSYYEDLGGGVTLYRPINAGGNRSAGAEYTIKTPVSKHWKVSFNLDLAYREVPLVTAAGQMARGAVTYVSNSSLEYDADKGDQVQFDLGLVSRQLNAQGYTAATSHLDLTWRHNITKKLALVVNAQDMLGGMRWRAVYNTADFKSREVHPATDRILRISLTRTFGGPKR